MTLDEALRVLELAGGESPAEIGKAHTRLARRHKADSDALARIHEAFERLTAPEGAAFRAPMRAAPPAPVVAGQPSSNDALRAQLDASLVDASEPDAVSLLRDFLVLRPDDDDARWWLVEKLERLDDKPGALEALALGARAGHARHELAAALFERNPFAGDDETLAVLRANAEGYEPTLVIALAAHEREAEALELARTSIRAAASTRQDRDVWIEAALRAFGAGDLVLGRAILLETDRHLPADPTVPKSRARMKDLLAHELGRCGDGVEDALFCALASAIVHDDGDTPELDAIRKADPIAARAAFGEIARKSEPLGSYASAALVGERWNAALAKSPPGTSRAPYWIASLIVFSILRVIGGAVLDAGSHSHSSTTAPDALPGARLPEVEILCASTAQLGMSDVCDDARHLDVALAGGHCEAARARGHELEDHLTDAAPTPAAEVAATALLGRIAAACPLDR